jgi:hypothetical protein
VSTLPQDLLDVAREATSPSAREVDDLVRSLRPSPTPRRYGWAIGLAAAAALLAFTLLRPGPGYGPAPQGDIVLSATPLFFGPSITVTGAGSGKVAAAGPEGTRIELRQGELTASVQVGGAFRALTIATPDGTEVSVTGTVFTVTWDGSAGSVSVARGRVAVHGADLDTELAVGERATWNDGATAGEGDPSEGGALDVPGRGDHLLAEPAPVQAPMVVPVAVRPDPQPAPELESAPDPPDDPVGSEPVALLEEQPADPTSARDSLTRAKAFGRVQQALEEERLADAEHLAGLFIQRYPTGTLSSKAAVFRIEAVAARDPAAAVALADSWLAGHRDLDQRQDVLKLRATAARDGLKDCALALPSYEELARLASGGEEARALAFFGLCAADVGDVDRARPALDAALAHPSLPRALAPHVRSARDRLPEDTP